MDNKKYLLVSILLITTFLAGLLINIQRILPAPHLNDLDTGSFMDSLYALALAAIVLFLAAGLGQFIIKSFNLTSWTFVERTVVGLPIGLAVIAYGEFFMGLLGWLKPIHHLVWLILIAIVSIRHSTDFLRESLEALKNLRSIWKDFSVIKKALFTIGLLVIVLSLILTFTPPWDYDGLMYHLEGPKLFLQAGRILPVAENWCTYYPATWEMLYMLGMGLGSDIFARLMHFSTLILLFLAAHSFGRRFLPGSGGWLSAVIMVGIPILFLWGISTYVDLAWALFQFLTVALFIAWTQKRSPPYLILAGIMQGLSMGSKYFALTNAVILGLGVMIFSLTGEKRSSTWKGMLRNIFFFGVSALLVASPWYLKNILWTGSPFFPLFFPQNIIPQAQIQLWVNYMDNFGVGKQWYDYLLLPFTIYLNFDKFGAFLKSMDMPSPIFIACWAYPVVRKRFAEKSRHALDLLTAVTALQFIAWAFGPLQNRFLIPIYPNLSIIASAVLLSFSKRLRAHHLGRIITTGLTSGMVVSSLIFMGLYHWILKPSQLLLGVQSKRDFLQFVLKDWNGLQYINNDLPSETKVFMPWNGRGYYCNDKCLPDVDQSKWTALVQRTSDNQEVLVWLEENEITHFLISKEDISYFLTSHDGDGLVRASYEFLVNEFAPQCTEKVFDDDDVLILKIDPEKPTCQSDVK